MFEDRDPKRFNKTETEKNAEQVINTLAAIDANSSEKIMMKEIEMFSFTFKESYQIVIPESWETDLKNGRIFFGHCELHLQDAAFSKGALEKGFDTLIEKEAREAGIYVYWRPISREENDWKELRCSPSKNSQLDSVEETLKLEGIGTCEPTTRFNLMPRFMRQSVLARSREVSKSSVQGR